MEDSNKLFGTIAVGVIGIIGVSLIVKMFRDKRQQSSSSRATSDNNVRIAQSLNSAIHPGRNVISDMFKSPDVDEIFKIAGEIEKFEDVSKEYRNIYKENLSLELQDALGDEYADFIRILSNVEQGTNTASPSDVIGLADELYDEMNGWNFFRNTEPYSKLYRLSDVNFKIVIETFNNKHNTDFETMLKDEYTQSIYESGGKLSGFADIKEKILKRYNSLF